ncbi:Uridine nucleosidase 1 [Thelohanellus kitauei]|uniref:Uridine nucleosidase 1 n=1 Tax=Thelohanellus kitauei TaxID=669202 RepID=A0A0C2MXL8_THEKT|nr:Uridine nucleosidase 1 [Thelohanellus kitauei]
MKVIIDTDVGIDDILSITYLLARKDVEIVAITLVAGNAPLDVVSSNIEKVLTVIGEKTIPIYAGGAIPIDEYFGPDGKAEIELQDQEVFVSKEMQSAEALIHYTKKYPNQLHGVFIGPLTNLAVAFLVDNEFPSRLASINIMGGDRGELTLKNASDCAEFNVWCDPPAYVILKECILKMNVPTTIVDWKLCWTTRLPFSLEQNVKKKRSESIKTNKYLEIFDKFLDRNNKYIKRGYYEEGILTSDLYVAVGLTNRSIFKTIKKGNITNVVLSGERVGHVDFDEDPNGKLDIVYEVDTEEMVKIIVNTISGEC